MHASVGAGRAEKTKQKASFLTPTENSPGNGNSMFSFLRLLLLLPLLRRRRRRQMMADDVMRSHTNEIITTDGLSI